LPLDTSQKTEPCVGSLHLSLLKLLDEAEGLQAVVRKAAASLFLKPEDRPHLTAVDTEGQDADLVRVERMGK